MHREEEERGERRAAAWGFIVAASEPKSRDVIEDDSVHHRPRIHVHPRSLNGSSDARFALPLPGGGRWSEISFDGRKMYSFIRINVAASKQAAFQNRAENRAARLKTLERESSSPPSGVWSLVSLDWKPGLTFPSVLSVRLGLRRCQAPPTLAVRPRGGRSGGARGQAGP